MTPEQLAKSKTEHSEQVALFAWCAMASTFGVNAANDQNSYSLAGYAKSLADNGHSIPEPRLGLLYAIHNQGHGDKIRGGRAKAEGVRAGVPDICLPVPRNSNIEVELGNIRQATFYHGLYIELKKEKDGRASKVQNDYIEALKAQGYKVEICHGFKAAIAVILEYLGYRRS
jgi:hypothetical protein